MKKFLLSTIIGLSLFIISTTKTEAAPVEINVNREYTVNESFEMKVKETRVVHNNTTNSIISKQGNSETFRILALYENEDNTETLDQMASTVTVTDDNGVSMNYGVDHENNSISINVPYLSNISPGGSSTFIFQYTNYQLAQKTGALVDIFILGFADDFQFESDNVKYTYSTTLKVPKTLGEENFITPTPTGQSSEDVYSIYTFSQEELVGTYVWLQLGKSQYYKFTITQEIPPTEDTVTGNRNEYRMILPRDFDGEQTTQKVYFTKIDPAPDYIEQDSDNNLIGVFFFKSSDKYTITLEGYAVVSATRLVDNNEMGTLTDLTGKLDNVYYSEAEYWEVNSALIQSKAIELKGDKQSISDIISTTYKFVVDSIDYSQVKRFGINIRQGALKTLQGGAAVCMEYSDLYITLLRAQGIPARAAFGYGYDSKDPAEQQELHQWVQVYIPTTGKWLSIDPTWGESGPALIGGDMNHFLTHVASVNPNEPPTLSGKTYGSRVNFDNVKFTIEALGSLPDMEMQTEEDLLAEFKQTEKSEMQSVFDTIKFKFDAGLESLKTDGFDPRNSAQLIVIGAGCCGIIVFLTLIWLLLKPFRRPKKSISINVDNDYPPSVTVSSTPFGSQS